MMCQALSRNHFAVLTGNASRDGRNIIIDPEMVDVDEEEKKIVNLAFERCLSKINHGYDQETAILIYVDFYRKLSIRSRNSLIERTRLFIYDNDIDIYGIYYCYSADYGVDGIQKDSSIR
ncbi:hypothetical protein [Herpetosiphon geysericola]|uniref:hypothetical protein n=1 Tax=Herpetosiphon geysericola TaxID=70996 RepID=UPI00128F8E8A|nr:hypothetical protein [Herpetosiphon geysericola]